MKTDKDLFVRMAGALNKAGGGYVGSWSAQTALWFAGKGLPEELCRLFECYIPKQELWAGAGALFDDDGIVRWNSDFPEGLRERLLIIGTAANGDLICTDLATGAIGYVNHEQDWRRHPRGSFISVSPSIGQYLRDINDDPPKVPEDFWDARKDLRR